MELSGAKQTPLVPANTEQLLAELKQLSEQINVAKETEIKPVAQGLVIKGK